jgi:predicted small lipoprotein YifL
MKKFMSVLCALSATAILSLAFTGCGEKAEQPAKTEPTSVEQPKQAEQPAEAEQPSSEHPK